MTVPEDPDTWKPVTTRLQDLLLVSIARKKDARLLKALTQAKPWVGELVPAAPGSAVVFREEDTIAGIYAQMEAASLIACCARQGSHEDDVTFLCIRGSEAILALNKILGELRWR